MADKLWEQIQEVFPDATQGALMKRYTTFKIGGPAKYLVPVKSIEDLQKALEIANQHHLEYFVFGGASNMLVSDEGFDGMAIKIEMNTHSAVDDKIIADAGAFTAVLARASVDAGLKGFEWAAGIPGTIGGAVRGNAGAHGGDINSTVESVEALVDGEVQHFSNADCKFGYRDSVFKHNGGIILGVTLKLQHDEERGGLKKMMEILDKRHKTQPKGPSSGCIFKKINFEESDASWTGKGIPEEFLAGKYISAGWLIEQAGLKGEKEGGAQVSDVHANFIMNIGDATSEDVKKLIARIKERVAEKFGIDLEEEIQYIV